MDGHAVKRLRESYDVWNEAGLEVVARDYWHPEIELEVPPGWEVLLGTARASGLENVVEVYRAGLSWIKETQAELLELEPANGEYICTMCFTGRGQSSRVEVQSVQLFQVVRMEDGRVRRIRFFADRESAQAAAGT